MLAGSVEDAFGGASREGPDMGQLRGTIESVIDAICTKVDDAHVDAFVTCHHMFVGQELLMRILSNKLVASFLDAPQGREEITLVQVRLFVLLRRWAHSPQSPRVATNPKAMAVLAGSVRHLLAACPWLNSSQKTLLFELSQLSQDDEKLDLFYAEVAGHLAQLAWPEDIARQLADIEGTITFGVPARDLLRHGGSPPRDDHQGTLSRAIRAYYRHVAHMYDLFTTFLLGEGKEEEEEEEGQGGASTRARAICQLLHVAQDCLSRGNFSTPLQVMMALQCEQVLFNEEAWALLGVEPFAQQAVEVYEDLLALMSPRSDFATLRAAMHRRLTLGEATVPYLGLFLGDAAACGSIWIANGRSKEDFIAWGHCLERAAVVQPYNEMARVFRSSPREEAP